jgi:hypothetical protein
MSRNEHDDVSGLDLPSPQGYNTDYIDEKGKVFNEEGKSTCAKIVHTTSGGKRYFVKLTGSTLYDPLMKHDVSYIRSRNWILRSTNKKCFELYVRYLSTGRKTLLHNAERSI